MKQIMSKNMKNIAIFIILFFIPVSLLNYDAIDNANTEDANRIKFDLLVREGDSFKWKASCINKLYYTQAIERYEKALEIDSSNEEVLFKLAYYYDIIDSTNLAKHYYQTINSGHLKIKDYYKNIEYPKIDVSNVKKTFIYSDSLVEIFRKYGRKCSITFDYHLSYPEKYDSDKEWFFYNLEKIFEKRIFFTLYGDGEFEARKYDSNSKIFFCGKLPDSILTIILKTLKNGRIITLKHFFEEKDAEINRFYTGGCECGYPDFYWHAYHFERIKIETPIFSNNFDILCLTESKNDRILEPINGWELNLKYNSYLEDKEKAKLQLLSELWKYIFWMDLTKYETD